MNHCVPDWNMGDGSRNFPDLLSGSNQKKSMGPDHELVELLWRNGQVILNSQTHRKPNPATQESKQVHKAEQPFKGGVGPCGNSSNSIQDDEAASWLQYPLDDSLEKFCSDFFYEMPTADSIGAEKLTKEAEQETNIFTVSSAVRSQPVFNQSNNLHLADTAMPPPKFQISDSILQHPNSSFSRVVNFSHFSRPIKANLSLPNELCGEKGPGNLIQGEVGESSMVTINGSHCGSNQVQSEADLSRVSRNGGGAADIFVGAIKEDVQKISIRTDTGQTDTLEPTVTSSSGGSGGSFGKMGKQTASNQSHKRKGREADESECQSEEAEYESIEASKPVQRSMSARRSRAAEVHNLSERRRRDRINEKMKALQELIPHCNKSDKASMLDEAIEYLKSLQMQVQIMWMGSGMAPMMFPGVQHYISRMGMSMGMGMGNGPLPPIHSPVQFPKVPLLDPSIASVPPPNQQPMCPSPALNSINFQNQMQNSHLPEAYARYLGFHSMQSAPQAMNLFGYGSQTVQQSQKMSPPSSSGPYNGGGKLGKIERRPISLEKSNLVLNTLRTNAILK